MKTFKLLSVQFFTEDEVIAIELEDGLIINKEDDHNHWLLELYTDSKSLSFLQPFYDKQTSLLVHAIITKKENDPAPFEVLIKSIQHFEEKTSVLLEGTLKRNRVDYAELLLDHLLEEGFTGDTLSQKFKEYMHNKPQAFLDKQP